MISRLPLVFALFSLLVWAPLAHASKRVALVVGNSAYEHAPALKNPKNDATAISGTLQKLGFEVITGLDLAHVDFAQAVNRFRKKLKGADVGLLFYAGHGLQVHGQNYLAPIDAELDNETSLNFEAISLHVILKLMERSANTNLVFLDACRDNPLARNLARSMGTRSSGIGRGLAREETGLGTLISFATQPGNVALDGEGNNSPFATGLLKHIETPNLDVALVLRRVREDVIKATSGSQVPWSNSSLIGSFEFNPKTEAKTVAAKREEKAERVTTVSAKPFPDRQPSWAAYETTERVGNCAAYEAFEEAYPDSFHAKLSKAWRQTNCKQERKVASIGPPDTVAGDVKADLSDNPRELALALQKELNRVGCNAGRPDGDWGPRSRGALTQFNKHAKLALQTDKATAQAFKAVKGRTARVCPIAAVKTKKTNAATTRAANKNRGSSKSTEARVKALTEKYRKEYSDSGGRFAQTGVCFTCEERARRELGLPPKR